MHLEIDALCILVFHEDFVATSRYIKNVISFFVTFIFLGSNHIIPKFEILN